MGRVAEAAEVARRRDALSKRFPDPKGGLAKLYAYISGERAPPTAVLESRGESGVTSNVGVISQKVAVAWEKVFSRHEGAQPQWEDLCPLVQGALSGIPPLLGYFPARKTCTVRLHAPSQRPPLASMHGVRLSSGICR